jgi:hypothetical protein
MHSFSGDLLGSRASFADSPDTAVRRVGNKKRPQVESCDPLKQKAKQEQQTQRQNTREIGEVQVGNVSEVKARIVRGEVSGESKKKRRGVA